MTPDSLLYFAADTFNIKLNLIEDRLRGYDQKKVVNIGLFEVPMEITVISDVLEENHCSFVARLTPSLWVYLVVKTASMTMYVFDALSQGWKIKDMKSVVCTGKVMTTLAKIEPAVRAKMQYDEIKKVWEYVPLKQTA
jgi:hypothetical protein